MAKLTTEELIEAFKELTLIELSEFVKAFEEVFEVTAAAPVVAAGAGVAAAGGDAPAEAEQTEFDVVVTNLGSSKIPALKAVAGVMGSSAMEAKKFLDELPKAVLTAVDQAAADKAKEALEGAGITVEIK